MISNSVFIDTSGFVAVWHNQDQYHASALSHWKELTSGKFHLLTSNYILDETFTLLRQRLGVDGVLLFREMLVGDPSLCQIVPVTVLDEQQAWLWFLRDLNRFSYTDATSFAIMQRMSIEIGFGFDHHFIQAGFRIFK